MLIYIANWLLFSIMFFSIGTAY